MTGMGVEVENASLFSKRANLAWLDLKSSKSLLVTAGPIFYGCVCILAIIREDLEHP